MAALELLTGFVTAPSTTQTALGMASGNSLTIRNNGGSGQIRLLQAWVDVQSAGILRIKSPNLHDDTQGIRIQTVASEPDPLLPLGVGQKLVSQDSITVDLSGSATASDIETACLLVYYEALPGIEGRFDTPDAVMQRIKHIMSVENTLSLGASGGYSGEEAINAEFDIFKANTDYALLGYTVDSECACVRWRGSETGNLGVGGPGNEASRQLTANWFMNLSRQHGLPLVPIFNSANKASILIDGAQDENGTDVTVNSIFAELE